MPSAGWSSGTWHTWKRWTTTKQRSLSFCPYLKCDPRARSLRQRARRNISCQAAGEPIRQSSSMDWSPSEETVLEKKRLCISELLLLWPTCCFWRLLGRVFQKWHFAKEKKCNTSTHPSWVYINQIWKNFFPKTSLEGLTSWSKMVKIDQNRRGGGMAVAWSFNSYQIVISSNTDCVSELWAEKKTCRQRRTTWWRARRRWPRPRNVYKKTFKLAGEAWRWRAAVEVFSRIASLRK